MTSSILIPVYNQHPDLLRACLRSALRQRGDITWEVVVVDDGSEPSVQWDIHQIYEQDVRGPDLSRTRMHYIRQANGGVAAALNTGLGAATGDYIHWLSSDDLFHPDKVHGQMQAMVDVGAKVSYCAYEDGIPQTHAICPAVQFPSREALFAALCQRCFISACAICWDATFLRDIGGFDTSFRHTQDYEVQLRSATRENFLAINERWMRRRTHPGQMSNLLRNKVEAEGKAVELARLNETYGCTARMWAPQ